MVSSDLGIVHFKGKESEIKVDVCCIVDSFISNFGLTDFQRILSIVGDFSGVDIFEKK